MCLLALRGQRKRFRGKGSEGKVQRERFLGLTGPGATLWPGFRRFKGFRGKVLKMDRPAAGGFLSLTGPLAPRVADCRSAAMLIKSALRDLLSVSYDMISILRIGSLRSPPPFRLRHWTRLRREGSEGSKGGGLPLRAMLIKSALRDLLSVSYDMISILQIGSLRSPPPIRLRRTSPAVRSVNRKEGPFMGRLRAYFDRLAHPMQDVHRGRIKLTHSEE